MAAAMDAPAPQRMDALAELDGVVVRQCTQTTDMILQALDISYEKQDRFIISALPKGKRAALEAGDEGWRPAYEELKALPPLMVAQERSSGCDRVLLEWIGCLNLRAFTMPFFSAGPSVDASGKPAVGAEAFHLDRPYHCGGCLCDPLVTHAVDQGGALIGTVKEDFRCIECCFLCTTYADVLEGAAGGQRRAFTLRSSLCCCGRVNNCCGATCCKSDLIMDVLDSDGKLVATMQKVYAPSQGMSSCLRCSFKFGNYIVEFPPGTSPAQKKLLLASLMHVNYQNFARTGGE